jgi:predicted Kef-type K+ transport protein
MKHKFLLFAVAAIALSNAYAADDLCSVSPRLGALDRSASSISTSNTVPLVARA